MQPWLGIRERIDHIYPSLRPAEQAVAQYIRDHTKKAASLSVGTLARTVHVSQPTVIRFSRKLGFDGYRELRYVLLNPEAEHEVTVDPLEGFELNPWDDLDDLVPKSIERDKSLLNELVEAIDRQSLQKAVALIAAANLIDIYGAGDSLGLMYDLFVKLNYLGLSCRLNEDSLVRHIGSGHLDPSSVAIAFAAGNVPSMVKTLRTARSQGAKTVAITNSPSKALKAWTDVSLHCIGDDESAQTTMAFSHIAQTSLINLLYMGIILSDYGRFSTELDRSGRLMASHE